MLFDKPREECGVFGVFSPKKTDVSKLTYYGLFALQHRGQESCGIFVNDGVEFRSYKELGVVNDVFTGERLTELGSGEMAVGHVRYATTGNADKANAQPIEVRHMRGRFALAHNGNLVNSAELRRGIEKDGAIFHSTSDTEVIAYIITRERIKTQSIEEAAGLAMDKLCGAYSLVIMTGDKLLAVRDKNGFRPLCIGITDDGAYIAASESCALDAVGARFLRDVEPGEIIVFDKDGMKSIKTHCNKAPRSVCVFEYIYFARPDSVIDGCSVHKARLRAGAFLSVEHPVQADVVIGVPDSGIDGAIGYAARSGIPYGMGFIKNKYIARTFIAPGQKSREDKVRIKLNPVVNTVRGKRVVLIDDSIVRGTTSGRIVKLLRDAGAKEVHMRITSPPFINPCYYGTDVDSRENLIACRHTVSETAKIIGADSLGYLSVESVKRIAGEEGGYCCACFNGQYPTQLPKDAGKDKFENNISD